MNRKRITKLFCLGLALMMLASCGGGSEGGNTPPNDAGSGTPTRTDMIMALNAEPTSLDPNNSLDAVTTVAQFAIYETLIAEKNGDSSTLEPQLAEEWYFNEDGTEIIFKIRQGVKFHNGDTMTTEDVAFSINRAIQSSFTSTITSTMDRMEVIDDQQVKLILKHAYLPALNCMTSSCMSVVSKHAVEECEASGKDFARNPVGTGAYQFSSWSSGEKIEVVRFDDYWRDPAALEKFTFRIITDSTTGGIALENGEIDILYGPGRSDKQHLESVPGITWDTIAGGGYCYISFNTTRENSPLADAKVRQAIAHALKKNDIMTVAVEGLGTIVECPLSPSIAGYDDAFEFWPYNPDRARELLKEAGYESGLTVSMKVNQQALYAKAAEAIQAQLREVGIIMEIDLMERGAFLSDVMNNMDYDFTTYLSNAAVPDADFELYRRFSSQQIGSSQNIHGVTSDEIDALLDKARYSLDQGERNELYRQVFEWNKDQCLMIPLYSANMNMAFNSNVENLHAHPTNKYFVYYYNWK